MAETSANPTFPETPPVAASPEKAFFNPVWYSDSVWRAGQLSALHLPHAARRALANALGLLWWAVAGGRRRAVTANLQPVCGSPAAARRLSRRVFQEFAHKLADLWRFEAGCDTTSLFGDLQGWEYLQSAYDRGQGVLLVSAHLGNWELGGPLLAQRGRSLTVVTQAEPAGLTERRQAARARWGIETVVIGNGGFGFVELIHRLESGATVAMLVDRPTPGTSVTVRLFGRAFQVSAAPVELARACGCALVPVTIIRKHGRYRGVAGPALAYDRASLRQPQSRLELLQQMTTQMEAAIGAHPEQWFHFSPIWPPENA